jgi:hypothetical protein
MATKIKIGHASISESGSVNGTAGDSTGREVYINEDFDITSLEPNVVLRPKTLTLAKASAAACEAGCKNNNIGYSQSGRNTLYNLAKEVGYDLSKVSTKCNTDCSAFMTVCAIVGGSRITYGSNAPTTTNMRTRFKQSGDYEVLVDSRHTKMTDYLKRGDILVCEGSHTVMVLENGSSSDDDSTDSGSTGVTTTVDLRFKHVDIEISEIATKKAIANIKVIERKVGVADKALSASKIKNYSWEYTLNPADSSTTKNVQLDLASSKKEITLADLKPETSYILQIIATNKKSGVKEFCSQKILFTTLPKKVVEKETKQKFTNKAANEIDHVYIKVDNEYKQAIIYNKQEV